MQWLAVLNLAIFGAFFTTGLIFGRVYLKRSSNEFISYVIAQIIYMMVCIQSALILF